MLWQKLTVAIGCSLVAWGCGSSEPQCLPGDEGCACFANNTCNGNLACKSSLCVDLGPRERPSAAGSMADGQTAGQRAQAGASGASPPSAIGTGTSGAMASTMSMAGRTGAPDGNNPMVAAGSHSMAPPQPDPSEPPPVSCTPRCGELECGPDPICQSSCGRCAASLECADGICRVPAPPRENGETCLVNKDCASTLCGKSVVGEMRCYGTAGPNQPCRDVFDCAHGVCVPMTLGATQQVCVDGLDACQELGVLGTCTSELAIAACQFNILCGTLAGDFNSCVRFGCMYWTQNPPSTGCPSQLSFARGGKVNCSPQP
jgi:hypothetical protein